MAKSRWSMLRAVADIPSNKEADGSNSSLSSNSKFLLPPGIDEAQLRDLDVGALKTSAIQSAEAFLRSATIPLPPAPPKTFLNIVKQDITVPALPVNYVDDFEAAAPKQELVVTQVPKEELKMREENMERDRIKAAQEEMDRFKVSKRNRERREREREREKKKKKKRSMLIRSRCRS